MTCLVTKVDDSMLWHNIFCHINFDNIVKVSTTFSIRNFIMIVRPTNVMSKECVMTKKKQMCISKQELIPYIREIGDCTQRFELSYKDKSILW